MCIQMTTETAFELGYQFWVVGRPVAIRTCCYRAVTGMTDHAVDLPVTACRFGPFNKDLDVTVGTSHGISIRCKGDAEGLVRRMTLHAGCLDLSGKM